MVSLSIISYEAYFVRSTFEVGASAIFIRQVFIILPIKRMREREKGRQRGKEGGKRVREDREGKREGRRGKRDIERRGERGECWTPKI